MFQSYCTCPNKHCVLKKLNMKLIIVFIALFITIPLQVNATNCIEMAVTGYCTDTMYRTTMCTSCAAECNALGGNSSCTEPVKTSECVDIAKNCASLKFLCTNKVYANLLAQKCMSTCNTCNGQPASAITTTVGTTKASNNSSSTTNSVSTTTTTP
uniref:ShKT domain-containing protein n=1 Tax=Strongyloides venezuelensis TaxID=75913 RepID=A0A0K0FJD3_STRVS